MSSFHNYSSIGGGNGGSVSDSGLRKVGGASKSDRKRAARFIFCIHGNKYGYAQCCDDLELGGALAEGGGSGSVNDGYERGGEDDEEHRSAVLERGSRSSDRRPL